jgi:3-oxoadipate enol-lactonase
MPLPVTTGRITRPDGATIAYEVSGSGPALVFAHGLGGNAMSWYQQVPVFAERYRTVAFSHRGFLPSTVNGPAPDPADYAADAEVLLDHLGIERAVFVGQSMGGWTSIELALAKPQRVAGIVLSCTTGTLAFQLETAPGAQKWKDFQKSEGEWLAANHIHRAAGRRMAVEDPIRFSAYMAIDRLNAGLNKDAVMKRLWETRNRGPADAVRVACPVLFVTGSDDIVVPPPGVKQVAATLPDARVVEVPASGHSVYFERPGLFNALVERFLAEIGWA